MFKPRPKQEQVLAYTGGMMGVSAVPGSGKTHTLSRLAANLIASGAINEDQEILIVTLVNSAVDNFSSRVGGFVQQYGLLSDLGYRVRTLHGLAHDIVRERPDLVGLSDRFNIVDERDSADIIKSAVNGWLRSHPEFYEEWSDPEFDLTNNQKLFRNWEETVTSLVRSFIRQAKDLQITPQALADLLADRKYTHPLLDLGLEVYTTYQRGLSFRSSVDFDDLIRLALLALESDQGYLQRLRSRWPYILEDEAQDSSQLQEKILRLLVGDHGNWVRVGDPNQAIYETFTTASPEHLRAFLREPGVIVRDLPDSGRSMPSIIQLANELIRWTNQDHPVEQLRQALSRPYIRPTSPDDPQPNPPDDPASIFLFMKAFKPDDELNSIVRSIQKWLPAHPEQTLAVLVPRNERGSKVAKALKDAGIPVVELLQSSQFTRQTAEILSNILKFLNDPASTPKMIAAYQSIRSDLRNRKLGDDPIVQQTFDLLGRCSKTENYLWPRPESNWIESVLSASPPAEVVDELLFFAEMMRRWQSAVLLPIDQLILTISRELFSEPPQLALAHNLALILERASQTHPDWQLAQLSEELSAVARNERRMLGYTEEDSGFDPENHKGEVVVATIHKAKGLEWDRVYLMSLNNYDFPSAQPYDQYISEKYFVRGQLNLEAETLSRLRALVDKDLSSLYLEEGIATAEARIEYCAERLRLFYVGITRARRSLIITWNTGRVGGRQRDNQPALPLVHLNSFWEERDAHSR